MDWSFLLLFVYFLLNLPELFIIAVASSSSKYTNDTLRTTPLEMQILRKFGIAKLRDFVRGRGRGSISRLSFSGDQEKLIEPELVSEKVDEQKQQQQQPEDIVELTEIGTPPTNLFHIIMPSSGHQNRKPETKKNTKIDVDLEKEENKENKVKKQGEEPRAEDYEQLAKILQKYLSRHRPTEEEEQEEKAKMPLTDQVSTTALPMFIFTDASTTTASSVKGKRPMKGSTVGTVPILVELGKSTVIEQSPGQEDRFIFSAESRNKLGNGDEAKVSPTLERVSWSGSVEKVIHEKAKEGGASPRASTSSSPNQPQFLRKILIHSSQLEQPEGKEREEKVGEIEGNDQPAAEKKAYVSVLREGIARQSDMTYTFVASITLIRDQQKVILVDTGMATDINGRTDLIEKLGRLNIAPPAIGFVVTTHGHADHSGNTNDFPDAIHFQGAMLHHRTKFNFSDLFEGDRHQLTDNVALIRTPGHTPEDISIVVSNTDRYGTVIVAGDTFLAAEDMDFPMMWRPLAWNETAQEESRRRILCLADYVVPGHGKVFRVTAEMRARVICEGRRGGERA